MVYKIVLSTENQVGKYIDLNGDGCPDGVIFADLAIGGLVHYSKNKECFNVPILRHDELSNYVVVGHYNGMFGNREVLRPVLEGKDRFYIMALQEFNDRDRFSWYNLAYNMEDYKDTTSKHFGTGRQNTKNMISKWNSKAYGEQNKGIAKDIWGQIQTQVENGWFIPSLEEWVAFKNVFPQAFIIRNGLCRFYWTSSQMDFEFVYTIDLASHKDATPDYPFAYNFVRLARTI